MKQKLETIDLSQLILEPAVPVHCRDICDLINLTYRGETGWTRETHIIGGDRTNLDEISTAMAKPDARFYVVYLEQLLTACIYLSREQCHAYIGFFSVHPNYQGIGVGKHILHQAEDIARQELAARRIRMFVVSQRPELIAFYQRRGYQRIGSQEPYPLQLKIGVPKVDGLTIEYLEKRI
ncbi:Ribosomal protein S18 acetylase RimI [Nitrosomonas marina]|uniref:Ribosomal protein S18 acetylase RimI n=1 Tax=Nitrosomonas marina TaxID=917 RepID=A0A1H9YBP3_9PROT|nr:GNAT family N-acetyltransferase [Nitrosomonas marina]SES66295.1 Ribosomal protein S18 acetylase RimI [Nitrosomonas marina]